MNAKIPLLTFVGIALLAVAFSFCVQTFQSRPSPIVRFVVPNNFRGIFLVYEDSTNGQNVAITNSELMWHVGDHGKVPVKDISALGQWHKLKGRFINGTEIQTYTAGPGSSVALYELFSVEGIGSYYFIGNEEEYERISKLDPFADIPLGSSEKP